MESESTDASECIGNMIAVISNIASMVPRGVSEDHGSVFIVKTGIPATGFNSVFAFSDEKADERTITRIGEVFAGDRLPWRLVTTEKNRTSIENVIKRFNLSHLQNAPGMVLRPLPDSPPDLPAELRIKQVNSQYELVQFFETSLRSFGDRREFAEEMTKSLAGREIASRFNTEFFLGYVGDQPVATSLSTYTGTTVGIYFVSTLPEFRGMGYGSAMTLWAAFRGREHGCVRSSLQATEIGFPVYEKIGYKTAVKLEVWGNPPRV